MLAAYTVSQIINAHATTVPQCLMVDNSDDGMDCAAYLDFIFSIGPDKPCLDWLDWLLRMAATA